MFKVIFSIAFFVFAALAVLIGVLKGRKYRWQLSVSKIILAIAGAIVGMGVSWLIGLLIGKAFSKTVSGWLVGLLPSLSDVAALGDIATAIGASIIAPLLFYAFFSIARAVANIFCFDLAKAIMKLDGDEADAEIERRLDAAEQGIDESEYLLKKIQGERKSKERKKLRKAELEVSEGNVIGAVCGGLLAFLIFSIYFIPVTGMCSIADDVVSFMSVTAVGDLGETVTGLTDGAANNAGAVTVRALGGKALYNGMTSYPVKGKMATLSKETAFLSDFATAFASTTRPSETFDKDESATLLRDSTKTFDKAVMMPAVFAEFLPDVGTAWANDESVPLIPKPAFAKNLTPIVKCLENTTTSTVKADYATLVNVYALAIEYEATSGLSSSDTMQIFSNEEFSYEVIKELLSNPTFAPSVTEITNSGVTSSCKKMEIHKNLDNYYETFKTDLYTVYMSSLGRPNQTTYLKAENSYVMDKVALRITDTAMDTFVAQEIQQFGAITPSEEDFQKFLAETPFDFKLLDNEIVHEPMNSQAQMEKYSFAITPAQLEIAHKEVSDTDNEAKMLSIAFHNIFEFNTMMGDKDNKVSTGDSIKVVGPLVDALSKTELVGKEQADTFLIAILQSGKIKNKTGISNIQAVNITESVSKEGNYIEAMDSLGRTIDIIKLSSSGTANEESIKTIISSITPESAENLKQLASKEVLEKHKVSINSSEKISNLMSDMFENMVTAKQSGISPEQLDKETAAVSDMFEILMNAKDTADSNLAFGSGSVTGLTAQEYVSRAISSGIISQTLVDSVYGGDVTPTLNPLNLKAELDASEKTELVNALNSAWQAGGGASNPNSAESQQLAKELTAIAALYNVPVSVSSAGVVGI